MLDSVLKCILAASKFDDTYLQRDVLRYNHSIFKGAPHGFYVVENKDSLEREVFGFFVGHNVFTALEEARRQRAPSERVRVSVHNMS